MRRDRLGHAFVGANRGGKDHQLRVFHRRSEIVIHLIAKADLGRTGAHIGADIETGDFLRQLAAPRRMGDGRPDQAQTDDGDLVEHQAAMNSCSSFTARRFCSSVPTVMRRQSGRS